MTAYKTPLPTLDRVRELLDYDPQTGLLRWKVSRGCVAKGSVAGWTQQGYVAVSIDGKQFRAHRLAWLLHYGEEPSDEIDHIDGDKSHNAIGNLREATHSENLSNRTRLDSRNTSGVTGVHHVRDKWAAWICVATRRMYLGVFDEFEDAVAAREAAELYHFGEFSPIHVRQPAGHQQALLDLGQET